MKRNYTIITQCTKCKVMLLSENGNEGKVIRCPKCSNNFTCVKTYGPIYWAQNLTSEFEKTVTKVIFQYGISVPENLQEMYLEHLSSQCAMGSEQNVTILADGTRYQVRLSRFINRRNQKCLHFRWSESDEIYLKLRQMLPEAYKHFIIDGNSDFFPGDRISVKLGSQPSSFELEVIGTDGMPVQQKKSESPSKNVTKTTKRKTTKRKPSDAESDVLSTLLDF